MSSVTGLAARAQRQPGAALAIEPGARSTDSETLSCRFLDWMQAQGWRSLGDVDAPRLRAWLEAMNRLGPLPLVVSDGRD